MELLTSRKLCDTCGSTLEFEMPSGFCPGCLLNTVLETGTEATAAPGSHIDDYELLSEVARGGMGIVYRARQRTPSRIVALKMILPAHLNSSGAVIRFRAEAEAAASLDNEGILPVYAVGEKDGAPFYSMKFAEGGSLTSRLAAFRDKPRESATLIAKLARAVAHAHERGILHRDLKPGNVLFDGTDKPFVSDFGLAKWLERECDLTQTLAILGTPYYMAPEQTADAHSITPAADIYSLGAILFHLLTGQPPFRGENAMEVLRKAAERPAPRPRTLNRKIPADLETVCLKCLEKNPAARYPSAPALAEDLDRFLASRPILARRASPVTHAARWTRRNPWIAVLGAALLSLLTILFSLLRPAARDAEAPKSIAVLPFENLSDDTTNAYFASGVHDDLLVNLARIASLKVISRDSVLPYQSGPRDLPAIGRALGVNAVLEGSVRRAGSRARINVQLIDTQKGEQIWAENYDREMKDVFGIQSDLAFQISAALKAKLSPGETARLRQPPTANGEAYLLYIQANEYYVEPRKLKPDLEKAEQLYEKALQLDPSFALAWAQLSRLESVWHSGQPGHDPARRAKAQAAAREALRLQPDLPEGHMALAEDYWRGSMVSGDSDFENALREFELARRGLPNEPDIYAGIGRIQRHQGKWAESIANLQKAALLDPKTPDRWHRVAGSYELTRNYAAADEALRRAMTLSPNRWDFELHQGYLNLYWKGDVAALEHLRAPTGTSPDDLYTEERFATKLLLRHYDEAEKILQEDSRDTFDGVPKTVLLGELFFQKGEKEKARAAFRTALPALERAEQMAPSDERWPLLVAQAYAAMGRREEVMERCKRATDIMPESKSAWFGAGVLERVAQIYAMLGDADHAVPILTHLLEVPSNVHRNALRLAPAWDPIRRDPRFQQLLEEPDRVFPVVLKRDSFFR